MNDSKEYKLQEGHPLNSYYKENDLIHSLLEELKSTDPRVDTLKFNNIFNQLRTIEKRFLRKENQLFPYLEKKGWHGPSKGMWSFHDTLRNEIKQYY